METDIEYISTNEAIGLIFQAGFGCVSNQTIISWVTKHNLGRKIGGRWKIDKAKLTNYLAGGENGIQERETS